MSTTTTKDRHGEHIVWREGMEKPELCSTFGQALMRAEELCLCDKCTYYVFKCVGHVEAQTTTKASRYAEDSL